MAGKPGFQLHYCPSQLESMAQTDHDEWAVGQKCEVFDHSNKEWVPGEIVEITKHLKVMLDDLEKVFPENSDDIRVSNAQQNDKKMTKNMMIEKAAHRFAADLSVSKPKVYKFLKDLYDNSHGNESITWRSIVEAVNHELYPVIGTALGQSVDDLVENGKLNADALSEKAVDKVLEVLKDKKQGLLNIESEYIRGMVKTAVRYKDIEHDADSDLDNKNESFFRYKEFNDISDLDPDADLIPNPKWKGLTANLVADIYGIFKAMKYGAFQREKYLKNDFLRDIESAESEILRGDAVSSLVEEINIEATVSFHPRYVIKDDLFQTVNPLLAMSLTLNNLESQQIGNGIKIKCVVVPALITSIYDETIEFDSNIDDIPSYLDQKLGRNSRRMVDQVSVTTEDIVKTADTLKEMMQFVLSRSNRNVTPSTIFLIFDRAAHSASAPTVTVHVFHVDDNLALSLIDLDRNYFVGMEMTVGSKAWRSFWNNESESTKCPLVRCWLRFGVGQRVRFVPEQLVWIVPALFARSTTTKPYDFWCKLYDDDYKQRWSVSLRDNTLSKFHHILTGNVLCSVNYRRDEVEVEQAQVDGLRDHLEQSLGMVLMEKMETLISEQRYDSDAVMEDVMEMENVNSNESNICRRLTIREWHRFKFEVMKYLRIGCDSNAKRDISDCPLIEEVIQNLIRFEQFGLEIDASNLFEFSLSPLVKGWDHLYGVHEYGMTSGPNRQSIRRHVLEHVQCNFGAECPAVQQHGDRKRENDLRRTERQKGSKEQDDYNDGQNDEVETLCDALRDTLCAVHSYLLHHDDELYRLRSGAAELRFATEVVEIEQKEDEMKNEEDDDDKANGTVKAPLSIDFGESVLEWLAFDDEPLFGSLREELIHNDDSTLDQDILDRMTVQCAAAIEDTDYTLKEALGLKTYADATAFQSELRKAHWKGSPLEIKRAYFHWAMTLYEAHLYHSKPIPSISSSVKNPRRVFHGLNRMFTMNHELPTYLGPFSVSTSKMVAKQFSNEQGLLFSIASSYLNPFKFCVGIDMVTFTSFKNEAEILLNNQPIPIKKTETFGDAMATLVNHLLWSLKNRKTRILDADVFFNKLGIEWDEEWIPKIAEHSLLFEKTECKELNVIDRLYIELGLNITHSVTDPVLATKAWERKHGDKSYLEYLVEDLKVGQLYDHYRVLTSKFKVVQSSSLLNRHWLQFERNTKMNDDFGDDCACFEDPMYQVDDATVYVGMSDVKSAVHTVSIKNVRLFGEHTIILQKVEHPETDSAVIAPITSLVNRETNIDVASWFVPVSKSTRHARIQLKIIGHRGHRGSAHPKHLLERGTDSYYWSTTENLPASDDWIIFKMNGEKQIVLTKIVIRNDNHPQRAIKTILVSGSTDNEHFVEWCKIEGIKKVWQNLIMFNIDPVSAHFAFTRGFTYFRINILENYGADSNAFCEFGIYGACLEDDDDSASNEVIDALSVDQYGCVFVDNIPSTTYSFQLGQEVQGIDGLNGIICRMTADKICIKMENGGMCHFRWIERVRAPTDITIVFLHQDDLPKYTFAATVNQRNKYVDFSKLKHYSFSNINEFTIPLREMLIDHSGVSAIDIYSKPKNSNYEWARIKSIDYSLKNVVDESENKAICASASAAAFNQLFASLKHRDKEIKNGQQFLRQFGIQTLPLTMWPDLFNVTFYQRKLVIERLIVEVFELSTECVRWLLNQKKDNKPLLQWLVEDRKLFRLLQHYRVMSSKFKMAKYSRLLNCSWLTSNKSTKMDHEFGIKNDDTSCFEKTDYRIDGNLVLFSNLAVDGRPEVVSVKNEELFGDKEVELQRFKQTMKVKESKRYLIDMLNIDAFGVISLRLDVGMSVQVTERDLVSRVTECGICTKIENDDMSIFQWIDKNDIWTKMKFENKEEISELEFAARAGSKDGAADTSYLKTFTFKNMRDVQIPCNKLIANSFPVDSIHIYARPKGTKLKYKHTKTLEHHFDSWFVCRYVVDQKEPVCIDKLIEVNPLSEPLQRRGQFNLVTTSKIEVSESGGICVAEQLKESQSKQEDDARFIYLSAPNGVVNRGTLCCEGTKTPSRVGTVHVFTDDLFENEGRIDTGERGRIKIECERFVNKGHISPFPNVVIGKWATRIRKFEFFSERHFEIKNNGLDIWGKSGWCTQYMVYPEMFSPDGISNGTHFWTILPVGQSRCSCSAGVLSERVLMDQLNDFVSSWPFNSIHNAYIRWSGKETLTVVLDCDHCKVEYFRNEKKIDQCDVIECGKSWYFGMAFCTGTSKHYRVVETPVAVLRHYQ